MSHTYATTAQFKDYLVNTGNTDLGTAGDSTLLTILEGASRRIDAFTNRKRSGFGPRVGTNTYDNDGGEVWLEDDLLSAGTVSARPSTGETAVVLAADTDYLLYPANETQKRRIAPSGVGSLSFGSGDQVFIVYGTWGYSNDTVTLGTMGTVSASATTVALSGGTAYPGATLLAESEQMYVTASTGGTALTVVRGVNGTTAATHAASTSVAQYVYPSEVISACLLVAQRRWRQREAGLVGDLSGGSLPFVGNRDTERSILTANLSGLMAPVVA